MTEAQKLISSIREAYLARTASAWRGYEREFLIELVRGLDEAAFAFTMAPNRHQLVREDAARQLILLGGASALRPFLEVLRDCRGGVPWGPTSPERSALADQHLINCGRLAVVERLIAMERYGLATTRFTGSDRLVVQILEEDNEEAAERSAGRWLKDSERARLQAAEARMISMKSDIAARIDSYSDVDAGWFLRYDPDWDTIAYHRDYAAIYAAGTAEADALPGNARIGGRAFADWTETSVTALGRMMHHIACATRLKATRQGLELRNLLTVYARKEDVEALWIETGETEEWAGRIIGGHTLTPEVASICERSYELPLPYYIDFGRHFFLLPMFGGLMNAHAGLVSHLRQTYRTDWDRAVDTREELFRADLREAFHPPRYVVPDRAFRLRRGDGSHLTDIDAVILDRRSGRVAVVQLKWPDIHGRSLAERNSRRANLLKANNWVDRVHSWVANRSSREIAAALSLDGGGEVPPSILVIARHAARFSGETGYDPRAGWFSWPTLMESFSNNPETEILGSTWTHQTGRKPRSKAPMNVGIHYLPGLTVEVRSPRPSKRRRAPTTTSPP